MILPEIDRLLVISYYTTPPGCGTTCKRLMVLFVDGMAVHHLPVRPGLPNADSRMPQSPPGGRALYSLVNLVRLINLRGVILTYVVNSTRWTGLQRNYGPGSGKTAKLQWPFFLRYVGRCRSGFQTYAVYTNSLSSDHSFSLLTLAFQRATKPSRKPSFSEVAVAAVG
jgi:hypothetical protein